MDVGFIGLGNMGAPIARRLLGAGHRVRVYNRTRARAEALAPDGAEVAGSPAEAASGVEVLFTMLADDAAVESVIFGPEGALVALERDTVHVSMSTISVDLSRRLAAEHRAAGQGYVAAPVFGRPEAAAQGQLWVIAAGPAETVERCRPLLDAVSQGVVAVGEQPEVANVVKLAGNLMFAAAIELLGETFALVRKYGMDPAQFLEIVNGQVMRSPVFANYGRIILEGRFQPAGFQLRHGLKDVSLVLRAADGVAAPLPVASLLRDRFLSGVARGLGDWDWATLARMVAEEAGLDPDAGSPTGRPGSTPAS